METFWWIIGGVSGFLVLAFIGGRYERRGERRRASDAADGRASEFIQQGFFRIRTAQNDRYKKERQERETEEHKRPVLAVVLVALAFLVGGWFVLDTAMSSEDWGWLLWFIPSFLAIPILLWWHKHFTDAETRADRDAPKKIVVLSLLLILEIHGGDSMVRLARDVGLGWDAHLSDVAYWWYAARGLLVAGALTALSIGIVNGELVKGLIIGHVLWLVWILVQA